MPSATSSSSDLPSLIAQLHNNLSHNSHQSSPQLLTKSKVALLHANALTPSQQTPPHVIAQAQQILELGALISIQMQNAQSAASFTRYFQQLQPFYEVPEQVAAEVSKTYPGQRSKITGLYLLLLLSQGDYAGFHTVLEGLESSAAEKARRGVKSKSVDEDEFIQYPVKLESWLMEGSYDRVWSATSGGGVPCQEFKIFSQILVNTIRREVASCSERAYSSIPVANAKNLLFLESEGGVVEFGQERGWTVQDGRVYFPQEEQDQDSEDVLGMSDTVIENTLGYARELEMIV